MMSLKIKYFLLIFNYMVWRISNYIRHIYAHLCTCILISTYIVHIYSDKLICVYVSIHVFSYICVCIHVCICIHKHEIHISLPFCILNKSVMVRKYNFLFIVEFLIILEKYPEVELYIEIWFCYLIRFLYSVFNTTIPHRIASCT